MAEQWFDRAYLDSLFTEGGPPRGRPAPKPPTRKWRWDRHVVAAHTRSEARAALKRLAGLRRLPAGANVVEVQ